MKRGQARAGKRCGNVTVLRENLRGYDHPLTRSAARCVRITKKSLRSASVDVDLVRLSLFLPELETTRWKMASARWDVNVSERHLRSRYSMRKFVGLMESTLIELRMWMRRRRA